MRRGTVLLKLTGVGVAIASVKIPVTLGSKVSGWIGIVAVGATLLHLEFRSLQDLVPAWLQVRQDGPNDPNDKKMLGWLVPRLSRSFLSHVSFLLSCASIGQELKASSNHSRIRLGFVMLWFLRSCFTHRLARNSHLMERSTTNSTHGCQSLTA